MKYFAKKININFIRLIIIILIVGFTRSLSTDPHLYIAIAFFIAIYFGINFASGIVKNFMDEQIKILTKDIKISEEKYIKTIYKLKNIQSKNKEIDKYIDESASKTNQDIAQIKQKYNDDLDDQSKRIGYQNIQNIKATKDFYNNELKNYILEECMSQIYQKIHTEDLSKEIINDLEEKIEQLNKN